MGTFPLKFLFGKTFAAATQPKPSVGSFFQCSECHQNFLYPSKCNRSLAKTFRANIWYLTKREFKKRIKFPLRIKCALTLKRIGMQYIESITTAPSLLQRGLLNWKLTSKIVVSYSCIVDCALNHPMC